MNSAEQLRVAIVDDTPDLRLLLRVVLESQPGFLVVGEAGDGAQGLELISRERPDLVLLDLAMPVMDGLEAVPLILASAPDTRIVVLSGFESERMAAPALAAGAHAYLQKGATPDEIVTLLRQTAGAATTSAAAALEISMPETEAEPVELEQLQAAMATAAHELRSPATILVGLAHTLSRRRDVLPAATMSQLLDAIVRQSRVLDRVTSDLLTSSQSSRGPISVDVEPMPLAPALEGAALGIGDQTELRVECPDDVWVKADRIRVDQILGNLLANAVKYAVPPVHLVAEESGAHAHVQVLDSGPGVPAEFQPKLFQQYSRADGVRGSGVGLGLFVVKSLAEAQGGSAWYEALANGGSGFCFSLPIASAGA
jgi:signal transduction histidine kinase